MSFQSKDSNVRGRQLKVQKLSIPFTITAHATSTSVVLLNDEPSICFLQSEGIDQITAALADGETATYTVAADDSDGKLNILLKVGEVVSKVVSARVASRATGVSQPCYLGDANGISSEGNIMLSVDSTVDHSTTNFDGSLEVEYVIAE